MAGASSFIDGAMKGYGFVDDIYRRNEYDKQRAETHGALMKARELSNKASQWTVDDEADRRRANEFATGKMNVPPGQMDPMAMPAQSEMTEAVPGVEVTPLPRAGVVPPVTGDATAPMPGLEKVNPLPAPMAMAAPDAPAGPAPMQGAAPAPAAPAAAPGMPTATLSQGARRQQQAEMAAQAAALRQQLRVFRADLRAAFVQPLGHSHLPVNVRRARRVAGRLGQHDHVHGSGRLARRIAKRHRELYGLLRARRNRRRDPRDLLSATPRRRYNQ
jgi:hypothetical protein